MPLHVKYARDAHGVVQFRWRDKDEQTYLQVLQLDEVGGNGEKICVGEIVNAHHIEALES